MLPSLVENAIKHGLEPQREGGNVRISAERVEGKLRLVVADTGRGFAETLGTGVGLTNIRERLAALYGDAAQAHARSQRAARRGRHDSKSRPTARARLRRRRPRRRRPSAAESPHRRARWRPALPKEQTNTQKALAVLATIERGWRKGLSYVFVGFAVAAVVVAVLAFFAMLFGELPVEIGNEALTGPTGALVGTLGILVGLLAVVLALAIVTVVVYGLGFVVVGIAIFIPIVVLVSISPLLAPFVLIGAAASGGPCRKQEGAGSRDAEVESRHAHRHRRRGRADPSQPARGEAHASSGRSWRSSPRSRTAPPRSRRSRTASPISCSSTSRCPR